MKIQNHFEPTRFFKLIKLELYRSWKGIVIVMAITFGILLIAFVLDNIFGNVKEYYDHAEDYAFFILVCGFILTSLAFSDLGNPLRRYNYLTLPASNFEKFTSMWLLTTVGWIVVFTLIFFLYSLISNAIGKVIFPNIKFADFNPFSELPLTSIACYVVFQAIFLLGAVSFKGFVFPKTMLTLLIFGFFCGLIFYLITADIYSMGAEFTGEKNPFKQQELFNYSKAVVEIGKWAMPILLCLITYWRLKEQEV